MYRQISLQTYRIYMQIYIYIYVCMYVCNPTKIYMKNEDMPIMIY